MRLLFLCGSLDPGRDGVGDYVRTLAASCRERGVEVRAIALNDPAAPAESPASADELRLSSSLRWAARTTAVLRSIDAFAPDWISLQFVPYAFDSRGLTTGLNRLLGSLPPAARRHLMFHETWITGRRGESWRRRIMGFLQHQSILSILAAFRPSVVHTTNLEYQRLLRPLLNPLGLATSVLPVFSNIPLVAERGDAWLHSQLSTAGVPLDPTPLVAILFGTIYPEWDPAPLLQVFQRANRRACFVSVGHLREGAGVWEAMQHTAAGAHDFVRLGQLPPGEISKALAAADLGVSAMPLGILDKSGTAAAMLEHGLPVLVTRFDGPLEAGKTESLHARGIYPVTDDAARLLQEGLPKRPPASRWLLKVTGLLLESLGHPYAKGRQAQTA
jgi:glycosyltransferase involved in cell wall biosynthesis